MPNTKPDPIRPTDVDACKQARLLLQQARHGAIAFLDPQSNAPMVARIAIAWLDIIPGLLFLASDLSRHAAAIGHDGRVSIMAGEPGRGDPLAHPRISVAGIALPVAADAPQLRLWREQWLERHPKSALYVDFADFRFYRLEIREAFLNAGFGKAYMLEPGDLLPPQ